MINVKNRFPFIKQKDSMCCGVTCLQMICAYYGKALGQEYLSNLCFSSKDGVSLLGIKDAAVALGFHTFSGRLTTKGLSSAIFPSILHWNQNHFVGIRGTSI